MIRQTAFALVLAGIAAAAPAARKPVIATPAGKAIDCVRTTDIQETRVRDDSTIDFYMRDRKVYRNVLPNSCSQLGFEEAFSYTLPTTELCSVDVITVIHRAGGGIPGPTCGLGAFQPVTIAR